MLIQRWFGDADNVWLSLGGGGSPEAKAAFHEVGRNGGTRI